MRWKRYGILKMKPIKYVNLRRYKKKKKKNPVYAEEIMQINAIKSVGINMF